VAEPGRFQEKIMYYYSHPDERGHDEIELKDGTIMERITGPVLGRDGTNYGRIWTFRDVTQSRRDQAALRESEANYYSLVDQMPAGIFRKDKEGRYVFVNSWFCRFKGAKPEDYLGKLPQELPSEVVSGPGGQSADAASLMTAGEQNDVFILRTGRQIEFDEKFTGADGKVTYFHTVKSPVFGPDGTVVGTQAFLTDITQRKQAENQLAYERDLLRTLLNNSPDHIYFKDLQSRLVRASRSELENLLRVASSRYHSSHPCDGADKLPPHLESLERFRDYVIGKTDADIYGHERAGSFRQDEQEIISTGQAMIGKIERTICAEGNSFWYKTTKVPWRNQHGEIIGTFGTSSDISDQKNAETRVEEAHKRLLELSRQAGMAEVATNVLHNVGNVLNSVNISAALVVDNAKKSKVPYLGKVAALLNEHAADLGAFMSHDPKGQQLPGYLSQLAEQLAREQQNAITELELLRRNIEHIKDIVAMQQNYAKISGVTETVNVTHLVEDALRMNAGALTRHEVELVREYADVPPVTVDKHRVLQILVNLIRNAKYACDDSGRKDKQLKLQVSRTETGVLIAVIDNGIGIPQENLPRIFNHGFTTRKGGHGFGLHSGALAARELGGSLTAHSNGPGQGAIFTLTLPRQPSRTDL
jgi:PAS domain S-box-containing protein